MTGTITPTYDGFGRTTNKVVSLQINSTNGFYNSISYDYHTGADGSESGLVSNYISKVGNTSSNTTQTQYWQYAYDENGNITQIRDKVGYVYYNYTYDDLGQLIREDNRAQGYSYTYTYDDSGNILSKKRYTFTTGTLGTADRTYTYEYGDATWGDLLTNFRGEDIEYDEIGNPIKIGYYDDSDEIWLYGYELTWDGRELVSYRAFETIDEPVYGLTVEYTYNSDGIRTSKTVDGVEHLYYLNGEQIIAETWNKGSVEHMLIYVYDETGAPIAIKYRSSTYAQDVYDVFFLEKNLQGDVVAVYNSSGTKIGSYTYDAWGSFTTTTDSSTAIDILMVVYYNPFRYRGYYYDTDTSLYYLQSRYYNHQWGRFINADEHVSTGQGLLGYNMFSYCNNNPIINVDSEGEFPWLVLAIVFVPAIIGAIIGATSDVDLTKTQESQVDASCVDMSMGEEEDYESQSLTFGTRVKNTVLGFSLGLVVGGALASTGGVVAGAAGMSFFGTSAAQTFAIGALAYDFPAICILPFYGVELEPIEYEPMSNTNLPQN